MNRIPCDENLKYDIETLKKISNENLKYDISYDPYQNEIIIAEKNLIKEEWFMVCADTFKRIGEEESIFWINAYLKNIRLKELMKFLCKLNTETKKMDKETFDKFLSESFITYNQLMFLKATENFDKYEKSIEEKIQELNLENLKRSISKM